MQPYLNIATVLVFVAVLIAVSYVDLRRRKIPDIFTIGGLLLVFSLHLAAGYRAALWSVGAAAVGFAAIWLVHRISGGRIGMGDAKLSAFISATVGLVGWFFALFVASFLALAVSIGLMVAGRMNRRDAIPFAPFLAVGGIGFIVLNELNVGFLSDLPIL